MRVVSLGSSSSGNALLVEAGPHRRTKLLVDAGFHSRVLAERLHKAGVHLTDLQGVLVTHEHSDHILGLPTLMKRYKIPVITNPPTYDAITNGLQRGMWRTDSGTLISAQQEELSDEPTSSGSTIVEAAEAELVNAHLHPLPDGAQEKKFVTHLMDSGSTRLIGDITVTSFPISHDAVAPCGYLLSSGGCRVCVITDSGEVTPAMLPMIEQADLLVLEANHDRERLLRGPYPYFLKERILSPTGHLSNDQTADAILRTWRKDGLRWLWLSHLSRTNNTPSLALRSILTRLKSSRANLSQIHISVSPPNMGNVWDSTQMWHMPTLWNVPY